MRAHPNAKFLLNCGHCRQNAEVLMARVVAVHGIGQQFKGDAIIAREWLPAIQSGLHLAGGDLQAADLSCPFYGHLFHPSAALGPAHVDPDSLADEERELLKMWWEEAAKADPDKVISPQEYAGAETLIRYPRFVQRAVNALAQSPFWTDMAQNIMLGDLKQVTAYMSDRDLHDQILGVVMDAIKPDTRVVIGHSLGSVVCYEALCAKPNEVVSLLTIGSPLGIRKLIFEKLRPAPTANLLGHWPADVRHWTNIADTGDIVALEKNLGSFFGNAVKDILVNNGSDAHHGERYLVTKEAGEAVREGLV
jgi:hypothetical protein